MKPLSQIGKELRDVLSNRLIYAWVKFIGFMKRNKYGVMGTIAFHMLLLIVLLLFKLNTKREFVETEIFFDIPIEVAEQILQEEQEKIKKELEEKDPELSKSVDELLRSIAVNENLKKTNSDPRQDVNKMIEEIKSDLSEYTSDDASANTSDMDQYKKDSLTASQEKEKQRVLDSLQSVEYSGASSVYYNLEGRHKIYLPIPVFKCEEEGLVVVQIIVNRAGKVIQTKIVKSESGVEDRCLYDAALQASRKARFNVSSNSPEQQQGTISYHFVKQ